jgi:Mg-chelatase subunit ChlD
MITQCPKCSYQNMPGSKFCQNCGTILSAPPGGANTVVMTTQEIAPYVIPPKQANTVIKNFQKSLGNNLTPPSLTGSVNQREHTVFVIDISDSMSERYDNKLTKLEAAKRANLSLVINKAHIDIEDEIGVVAFDAYAYMKCPICPLAISKRNITETIQSLNYGGGTDINAGLVAARDLFDWTQAGIVRRIVLLTDGHGGYPLTTANELKEKNVVIDVIGVGDTPSNVDEKLLKKVASTIQGELRYRFIKDQHSLVTHYTMLANKTQIR